MDRILDILFLFPLLFLLLQPSSSHPLCTDSTAPLTPKTPLTFCPYNGSICCDSIKDSQLQKQFLSMNISDQACASLMQSILCASCDQFSAELFTIESGARTVPVLCNSTILEDSTQSNSSAANDYCGTVWDTCNNVTMLNSPFNSSLNPNSSSKLTDFWSSKNEFCNLFGGASSNESVCFSGEAVTLENTEIQDPPPNGLCIERISNGSFLNLAPHPDGSNRIFLGDQMGRIWLVSVPAMGSGETIVVDESNPFLDITNQVHVSDSFGVMGIAFHPNFVHNGRFFVSFNCDKTEWPGCSGRCSCNSDVNCDPTKLGLDGGSFPCQYYTIVSEFTANGTNAQILSSMAEASSPTEVRRIFSMGLPFTNHHGGQLLFGPEDGYLYFMMGDGGKDDPYNFAQNKKSVLGKIMRLDVDNLPTAKETTQLGLWGNYSIPQDNPYSEDPTLRPEIWAWGFRNPWRCSFDAERPEYFMCSDDVVSTYEEVNMITKGGNYGWRTYEGTYLFNTTDSPGGHTSPKSINAIFPVMGYNFSEVNKGDGSAALIGGYFYRSMADPCMYGRYLFADLYGAAIFAGTETPENSGNFTRNQLPFSCALDSPLKCGSTADGLPDLGFILSFAEDNSNDIFLITANGLFRIVQPSRCNYACSKEQITAPLSPAASPSYLSSGIQLRRQPYVLEAFFFLLFLMLGFML
ncbi:HIPL1 protein-like [Macadamia integrifolia]|uniref:HIPL1 protein-like n=1 Tax=Macadamia integrifolia TaxID=60698 RepID=UPI001C4F5617|nr:HIPL1 protein-like [Macadamia integrifolia]